MSSRQPLRYSLVVYTFARNVDIHARPARVWRALCDPAEVAQWDASVSAALDAPADYPHPGQHVRWRYTAGVFRVLHDRPQEVVPERLLRSLLRVGPYYFDETYTLTPDAAGCRLTLCVRGYIPLRLVGVAIEMLYLKARIRSAVVASLEAIKRHCEADAR